MNRRDLIKGLVGLAAGAVILPPTLEENVEASRRIWTGWRPETVPFPHQTRRLQLVKGVLTFGDLMYAMNEVYEYTWTYTITDHIYIPVANVRALEAVMPEFSRTIRIGDLSHEDSPTRIPPASVLGGSVEVHSLQHRHRAGGGR